MFVAIEGIDGSGKGTQTKLVQALAVAAGYSVASISFPQYGQNPFATAVSDYLNGRFGNLDAVHPKLAALLFAGDRFASRQTLIVACEKNNLVLCDRYVASNMAHQAAKLPASEHADFIDWVSDLEFTAYALPRADLTIFLDIPADAAQALIAKKPARDHYATVNETGQHGYTTLKADIHEQDLSYLTRCREVYFSLASQNVGGPWVKICVLDEGGTLRPADDIAAEIWQNTRTRLR